MGYKPHYKKAASKYLDAQSKTNQIRILDAVKKLPEGNVCKMKGRTGFRLVVGDFHTLDFRVLFKITDIISDDGRIIIDIINIGPRGDVYK